MISRLFPLLIIILMRSQCGRYNLSRLIARMDTKPTEYSRRFATATARTASLGSHSRGIETKNIRKYWLSEKKNAKNLMAMYSGPTQFKK